MAIAVSLVATAISIGPWTAPYQIRSMKYVSDRFGKPAARILWLTIAIVSGSSGVAILNGLRPSYATTRVQSVPLRQLSLGWLLFSGDRCSDLRVEGVHEVRC